MMGQFSGSVLMYFMFVFFMCCQFLDWVNVCELKVLIIVCILMFCFVVWIIVLVMVWFDILFSQIQNSRCIWLWVLFKVVIRLVMVLLFLVSRVVWLLVMVINFVVVWLVVMIGVVKLGVLCSVLGLGFYNFDRCEWILVMVL